MTSPAHNFAPKKAWLGPLCNCQRANSRKAQKCKSEKVERIGGDQAAGVRPFARKLIPEENRPLRSFCQWLIVASTSCT
ncbi:hypothetical protein SAMN05216215_103366 [Saccharopolyspora shandongensis]|uniref:Uncharacterized protein n=1 Tax=Saccharopolyspora shandongensis TaxID=418495 RepID=A0A1H3M5G1_9PSEU|nr:hypothetical protein SAMN05216215_103366 [Saccharopolyspora shandongensis]